MTAGWVEKAPLFEGFLSSPEGMSSARAVIDLHTHECDLRTALGLPLMMPSDALAWIAEYMRSGFDEVVADAGLPPVTVGAAPIEVVRSRLGRRTVDEVSAYVWSAAPEPYLDLWFVFGRAEQSLGEQS